MKEIKLIAHGGFSAKYPENTMPSFVEAAKFRPYAIEMDAVLHPETGELICFHPSGISSGSGTYDEQTLREQINTGEVFPLLSDVVAKISSGNFLIDFKQPSETSFKALLKGEIDLDRIIVGIRNLEDYDLVRSINDDIRVLALFSDPDDYASFSQRGGQYFRLWEKDLDNNRVAALHDANLEVWVTPGHKATETQPRTAGEVDEEKFNWMIRLMVDAILVNDIELASGYLQ